MHTAEMSKRNIILHSVPENLSLSFSGRNRNSKSSDHNSSSDDKLFAETDREKIRWEVDSLIRDVLPDEEPENLNVMLEEFRGREEELLGMLRKMQERQKNENRVNGVSSTMVDPDDFIVESEDELDLTERRKSQRSSVGSAGSDAERGTSEFFDNWQADLDQQLDDSNSHPTSNPQGGGEALLKSPPEGMLKSPPESQLMMNGTSTSSVQEEKKNDSPHHGYENSPHNFSDVAVVHEDEHDVPHVDDNEISPVGVDEMPGEVRTNSMRNLKLSSLTVDGENGLPGEVRTNSMRSLKVSALTAQTDDQDTASTGSRSTLGTLPSGKKTVAMVKLRVWDPARPRGRLKLLTAAHIILPSQNEMDEASRTADARAAAMVREESENSRQRRLMKRLSIVKEEPEKPPGRGDSYLDEAKQSVHEGALEQAFSNALREVDDEGDEDENDVPPGEDGEGSDDSDPERAKLEVGTLVGIQLKSSSSSSSSKQVPASAAASVASNYSLSSSMSFMGKVPQDWKVGQGVSVHGINLLPCTNLSKLHYQIENDHSSLRELVLDGLPGGSFPMEEYELVFEALGTNVSIKRLSMRYSAVDDDLAALFALALVDNTTIAQLYLEGNEMTTVSAKNFYSVLKKNNDTLRLLDLSNNPLIDEDVERALDQFMEQRALKRTLTNKAEKARRAARGMPPDAALEEEDDECDGRVTVVCPQNVVDRMLGDGPDGEESEPGIEQQQQLEMVASASVASQSSLSQQPYPGENFRDYMERMNSLRKDMESSQSYQQKMMEDSVKERKAFDEFAAAEGRPQDGSDSMGSSLTSKSTKKGAAENGAIATSSAAKDAAAVAEDYEGRPSAKTEKVSNRSQPPPERMDSLETQESRDATAKSGRRNSLKTEASEEDFLQESPRGAPRGMSLRGSMMTEASGPSSRFGPHPYHATNVSQTTGSSAELDISDNDYVDDKAGERAIRRQLAMSAGAIGAYHIDEAAPARQNRASGVGGGRRGRTARSESQRRARLAQLQGGGGATAIPAGDGGGGRDNVSAALDALMDADIERADETYRRMQMQKSKSAFSIIGMDGEESHTDRMVCGVVLLLLVGLLVMVILLLL